MVGPAGIVAIGTIGSDAWCRAFDEGGETLTGDQDMRPIRQSTRMTELRAIIDAYRNLTVEEAEGSDAGDREAEAVAELWRLEQAALDHPPHSASGRHRAA